jgi:hypothetical protein
MASLAAFFGHHVTVRELGLAALLTCATLTVSLSVLVAVIVKLPDGYLQGEEPEPFVHARTRFGRAAVAIVKNLVGVVCVVGGIVLSLPGVPGPGILTIFAGLLLIDIPGRHTRVRRLLRHRVALATVNRIRSRFDRPPLDLQPT